MDEPLDWLRAYDPDGLPITGTLAEQVERLGGVFMADRHVADDTFDVDGCTVRVSTVFLVVDHEFRTSGEHVPILWETGVFVDDDMVWMGRATTRAQAEVMHAATVKQARTGEWALSRSKDAHSDED